MMILKRRLSRDRRLLKVVEMQSLRDDMRRESVFEEQAFETENQLRSGRPIAFERHFSGGLERHWGQFLARPFRMLPAPNLSLFTQTIRFEPWGSLSRLR
jgi:hypothetical protein